MKYFSWFFIFSVVITLLSSCASVNSNNPILNLYTDKISPGLTVDINSSVTCSSLETFIDEIITPFNEESVFSGFASTQDNQTVIYEFFYNYETQSFTIAQHLASGNTCFLGGGEVVFMTTLVNSNNDN